MKILNKAVQNAMIHVAEPLSTVSFFLGGKYEKGYLDTAWRYILQSHPHDSINGVTQDKTANDVEYRLQQALEMSQVLRDKAIAQIVKRIKISDYNEGEQLLVVFNPHLYPVSDVIRTCICTPQKDSVWDIRAIDSKGKQLELQVISRDEKTFPVHDLEARPWPYATDRHHCYINTGEIPPMGYKTIHILPENHFDRTHFFWIPMRTSIGEDICRTGNVLENEFLKVVINNNGTLHVTDKGNNHTYDGLHYFEDTGDVGNYWAYYPPYRNKTYTTLTGQVQSWCEDNGPLFATIGICYTMLLPKCGYESKYGVRGEGKRSDDMTELTIHSYITLKKGSRRIDIKTKLSNTVSNHRLRIAFPLGMKTEIVSSAGHFTVDERPAAPVKDKNNEYWPEMQTLPMQNFIDISDKERGVAIVNNCLSEYEMTDNDDAVVYLTLFRAMDNMIVTWWEAVGEFPDQNGSQCLRDMEFEYSVYPHEGTWSESTVYKEAENLNVPLLAYQICGDLDGDLPEEYSFMESTNPNIVFSAMKKAEDRDSMIIRLYNPTKDDLTTNVILQLESKEVWLCNLNEDRQKQLWPEVNTRLEISVLQNEIITIELVFAYDFDINSIVKV